MSSKELAPDEFELYDLKVTTRAFALKAKT